MKNYTNVDNKLVETEDSNLKNIYSLEQIKEELERWTKTKENALEQISYYEELLSHAESNGLKTIEEIATEEAAKREADAKKDK